MFLLLSDKKLKLHTFINMVNFNLKTITHGLSVLSLLALAACVTPQRQVAPAAPTVLESKPLASSAPAPTPARIVSSSTPKPEAPVAASSGAKNNTLANYQELLETQLLCSTKSLVSAGTMRKLSNSLGIFAKQGRKLANGAVIFPIAVDLSVFGFKVVALEIIGDDGAEGSAIFVDIKATPANAAKLFKSKHITLKSKKGDPGFWTERPAKSDSGEIFDYLQFTGYKQKGNLLMLGCYVDFPD